MRLLVIEDQSDLRRLLMEILEEAGYAVDVAADGEAGLLKAQLTAYDGIVLDLMLPRLDGWEFLRRLRIRHRTPVLILSARDALADRVQGLDLGADDYLPKPFERTELLARLRALIRRTAGHLRPVVEIADVQVDLHSRNVTKAGAGVALTAKEYALLECLALHRGRVLTRAELYDHVFDEHDESLSNLLEVYVSSLRKKLGADIIETRRGLGYVMPS